jgi:hypothetical protein
MGMARSRENFVALEDFLGISYGVRLDLAAGLRFPAVDLPFGIYLAVLSTDQVMQA